MRRNGWCVHRHGTGYVTATEGVENVAPGSDSTLRRLWIPQLFGKIVEQSNMLSFQGRSIRADELHDKTLPQWRW